MSENVSKKEIIEKLSNMREFIIKLCKEYNDGAKSIDMNGRIAIMNAEVWDHESVPEDETEEELKERVTKTWEEKAQSWDYDKSKDIVRCGANAWFPSAICN